jgi:predicted RNA binding protein YcfA (HicA-like mRNA interferase family)
MGDGLPRVTTREMISALERDGWRVVRQKGGHVHLTHPERPGRVTIPFHAGRTLKVATTASIIKQAGISPDRFRELL